MRFGSVCSGIEAASVAWHPLGWQAAWFSEIEPFPSAVLAHHYPDVPNLGDMTLLPERILSAEVEAPDLFCGGTPCQAFSVAGLRNSLDDARGNLSLIFAGIANAIDHVRSVRGDDPAIIFWENVPGVLSTKDNAFGCFLGALAGEDDPIVPPGGKWTNAGCVYGPQRTVAWRVLDAQYFGVAQRRRRVFVVASARSDFDPASVLFEFDGVRRDSAPGREKGQETSGTTAARFGISRNNHEECVAAPTKKWPADIASTLDTNFGTKQGLEDQHVNAGCPLFVPAQTFSTPAIGHIVEDDVASTMTKNTGGGGETQNPAFVAQPIAFQQTADCLTAAYGTKWNGNASATNGSLFAAQAIPIDTMNMTPGHSSGGLGFGQPGDPSFTLTKGHSHAVAQPIAFHPTQDPISSEDGTTHCMDTGSAKGGATVAVAQAVSENQRSELRLTDFTYAITSGGGKPGQGYPAALVPAKDYIGGVDYENNAHTMDQPTGPLLKGSPTGGGRPLPAIATAMMVRRLTPVECERLQGFPDNYTNIPWRKKPDSPDGPRYKALGNSWAVPNVRWIGQRIAEHLKAHP
jgi:DNA (cytosine-5)-methyltransferase 1